MAKQSEFEVLVSLNENGETVVGQMNGEDNYETILDFLEDYGVDVTNCVINITVIKGL